MPYTPGQYLWPVYTRAGLTGARNTLRVITARDRPCSRAVKKDHALYTGRVYRSCTRAVWVADGRIRLSVLNGKTPIRVHIPILL